MSYCLRKIPLNSIEKVDIIVTTNMTGNQVKSKYGGDYIINLALYDTATGGNITHLKDNNVKSGYLFSDEGLGVKGGVPFWCKKDVACASKEIEDYTSFSPVLVRNGKKDIQWGNKVSSYINGSHNRCFCGINDDHLFLGICNANVSIPQLADYCVSQGMKYAGNNDGNGSIYFKDTKGVIRNSSRKNATWLIVYLKKEIAEMVTKTKIMIDGKIKEVDTILKDGKNYVMLRSLEGESITIDYDAKNKLPIVNVGRKKA